MLILCAKKSYTLGGQLDTYFTFKSNNNNIVCFRFIRLQVRISIPPKKNINIKRKVFHPKKIRISCESINNGWHNLISK